MAFEILLADGLEALTVLVHKSLFDEVLQRELLPRNSPQLFSIQFQRLVFNHKLMDFLNCEIWTAVKLLKSVFLLVHYYNCDLEISKHCQFVRLLNDVSLALVLFALNIHVVEPFHLFIIEVLLPFELSFFRYLQFTSGLHVKLHSERLINSNNSIIKYQTESSK